MAKRILIIGSGMGGATMAAALAPTGAHIQILERGERIAALPETRDDKAIFVDGHFRPEETWLDGAGKEFNPGNYYYVGGNSKFYGAVLIRYRAEDFAELTHLGGTSPAWPISYAELEPWYQDAEEMFGVCGNAQEDPTEPRHSGAYPKKPVAHETDIEAVASGLKQAGVTPFHLPLGLDIEAWLAQGNTPWDAFPNTGAGKKDAESVSLAWALEHSNVRLTTGCEVLRILSEAGRVTGVEVRQDGEVKTLHADLVILAAGAVNSAAMLLRSANENQPNGLANRSDAVGRYFMNHNCSALLAMHPFRRNRAVYQKTLGFNDFYLTGGPNGAPLGNVQLLGKISGPILKANAPGLPGFAADWIASRSVDWYVMSEDLPDPESRVTLAADGRIRLDWKRSNWETHQALVAKTRAVLRKAGFPLVLARPFDRRTPSHQCGTVRFGRDPQTSVLDTYCRAHDVPNLFVVDAGFLPTSAAVNPALTIAAQALRVADHIAGKDLAA